MVVFEIAQRLQVLFQKWSLAEQEVESKYRIWRKIALLQRLESFPRNPSSSCDWNVLLGELAREAQQAFDALDTDADGKLSERELSHWCMPGGVPGEESELTALEKSLRGGAAEKVEEGESGMGPLDVTITQDLMRECDVLQQGCVSFPELWLVLEEAVCDMYT